MNLNEVRVEVALPLPIRHTFTYRVDSGSMPAVGTRVLAPFRQEERIGWVVGPGSSEVKTVRPLLAVLENEPSVPSELLDLCRWMARYYVAPLGITIRAALPAVLSDVSRDYLTLEGDSTIDLKPRERRLVDALSGKGEPQRVRTLRKRLGMGSIWPEVRSLEARGVIRHETVPPPAPSLKTRRVVRIVKRLETLAAREDVFGRASRQRELYELLELSGGGADLGHLTTTEGFSRGVVSGLEAKALVGLFDEEEFRDPFADAPIQTPPQLTPTADQRAALNAMVAGLDEPEPAPFLLQGITGSGKTLVYIELLREALARGKSAIVLVPEIALTPQTVSRFRAHFGDEVAVLHSGLSDGERYDAWRQLRSGQRRIAVGARSALFAPLANLGAIVVDESVTSGREFFPTTAGVPPHDWMNNRGGSIGYGLPVAVGAAIACPDRKVIALEGDGSAMYTIQSLWTMARESLDITILVFANGTYNILRGELTNVGVQNPGPRAVDMLSIDRPSLDWVSMARGMGVEASRAKTAEDLNKALEAGLHSEGPYLIEVAI